MKKILSFIMIVMVNMGGFLVCAWADGVTNYRYDNTFVKQINKDWAMICEREVLPNPGGPQSRRCSNGSFLCLAAERQTLRFSIVSFWPINSVSLRGRREMFKTTSSSASTETSVTGRLLSISFCLVSSLIGYNVLFVSADLYFPEQIFLPGDYFF